MGDVGYYGVDCGRGVGEGAGGGERLEWGRDEGPSGGVRRKLARSTRSVGRSGDAEGFHGGWSGQLEVLGCVKEG